MRTVTATVGPLAAASANGIATSQSLGAAGALNLNGSLVTNGVAALGAARRVGITSNGNDTGLTWTITGTDRAGLTISETLPGASGGVAQSALDYVTVTSIKGSAATASTVTAGTTTVASSKWVHLDEWASTPTILQCDVSGTVNYTVETTMDNPNSATSPVAPGSMNWFPSSDQNVVGATTSQQSALYTTPTYVRVTLNSGTGSAILRAGQSGSVNL